jgi:large subunit ribosomal protein L5
MSYVPTLKKLYTEQVAPELVKSRGYKNKHQVPKITKVVLNTGHRRRCADKNQIADIAARSRPDRRPEAGSHEVEEGHLQFQTAQRPDRRLLCDPPRQQHVGIPLPSPSGGAAFHPRLSRRPPKLDGQGNYNLGVTDFAIFPEITIENVKKTMGLDITIVTTANTDDEGRELLKLLGMPFRRSESAVKTNAA